MKYQLNEGDCIGKGAFSKVYKIAHAGSKGRCLKVITLKGLHRDVQRNLINEAAILKQIQHPNIVKYYSHELATDESKLMLEIELCSKGSLETRMERMKFMKRSFTDEQVWSIASQLIGALYRCHHGTETPPPSRGGPIIPSLPMGSKGIRVIHRDIKPANIFFDEDETLKLGDFGLSLVLQGIESASDFSGTPQYMAPEMWACRPYQKGSYDFKVDIWSLGCTLYELCAGERLFEILQYRQCPIDKICSRIPPHISKELSSMIQWCLRKNPEDRPTTKQLLECPALNCTRMIEVQVSRVLSDSIIGARNREAEWAKLKQEAGIKYGQIKDALMSKENELNDIKHKFAHLSIKINELQAQRTDLRPLKVKSDRKPSIRIHSPSGKVVLKHDIMRGDMNLSLDSHVSDLKTDGSNQMAVSSPRNGNVKHEGGATSATFDAWQKVLKDARIEGDAFLKQVTEDRLIRPHDTTIIDVEISLQLNRDRLKTELGKYRLGSGSLSDSICRCSGEVYAETLGATQANAYIMEYLKRETLNMR